MSAQVLLLRGVNVGGHGKLPMADLRALLSDLGGGTVRTYIQSGNAVVARAVAAGAVAGAIEAAHGFRPDVLALSAAEWRERVASRALAEDSKALHGFFGADLSLPDPGPIEALKGPGEEIAISLVREVCITHFIEMLTQSCLLYTIFLVFLCSSWIFLENLLVQQEILIHVR